MSILRLTGLAALAAIVGVLAFASAGVAAPPSAGTNAVTVPITTTDLTGTFNGVLSITQFAVQNGQIVALGTLTGAVTTAAGDVVSIAQDVVLPLLQATGSCPILHLELG